MTSEYSSIIGLIKQYVVNILKQRLTKNHTFHNLDHTFRVTHFAELIGKNSKVDIYDLECIILAAWFHDTGFTKSYIEHESASIEIAKDFLKRNNFPQKKIDQVVNCIECTRLNFIPSLPTQEIIKDADLAHLGLIDLENHQSQLRKELEYFTEIQYTDQEWTQININFMLEHNYYTNYAKTFFEPRKKENLKRLQEKLKTF
ncbi:MAG: HD domain-containing protein [Melioribacteraceae bacterium]|nr:HD domain-containing protein [Melioribacteraceae bacterium]MCF8353214.1 HD domain-containing protein [Melioribacteraceae bacterium]MCF8395605.1 HD domain-containing protein [Melioribacteraceae bacterium]MCF8418752.1 HD domain-containing protein [Melioribacteraceae bacterium]